MELCTLVPAYSGFPGKRPLNKSCCTHNFDGVVSVDMQQDSAFAIVLMFLDCRLCGYCQLFLKQMQTCGTAQ